MFETIATSYLQIFAVALPALALSLITIGATRAGLSVTRTGVVIGALAALFGIWYALVVALAKAGILMPPVELSDPPYAMMPLLGGAFLLWALGRLTATGRTILDNLDHIHLISIQSLRLMGGLFVVGWAMGVLPWQFALPAGIGDITAGIAAIQATRAAHRGDANAEHLIRRASIVGLLDFVVAVSTGIMTSPGVLQLMAFDTPNIINAYPLALFPMFIVPIFIAFQLFSLQALRRSTVQGVTA